MKNIISIFNLKGDIATQTEKIRFIIVLLFVFSLPFDKFYSTLCLHILIILSIIDFKKEKLKQIPKAFWVFQSVFFLSLIGYFYSHDKQTATSLIERQLAIFIFPLLLPLAIDITRERLYQILNTFTLSCTLTSFGLLSYLIYIANKFDIPFRSIFNSEEFFNHQFSEPIGIHATYLAIYINLCLFYISTLLLKKQLKKIIALFAILSIIILLAALFFLAARNALFSLIAILIFIIIPMILKNKKSVLIFTISLFSIVTVIISSSEYVRTRFSTELFDDISMGNSKTVLDPRVERWKLASELIIHSPLIGYGTGDEILMLKQKYKENGLVLSYLKEFNAHNQYISYLLKNGILGLAIFLASLIYYYKIAVKRKSIIYISFLTLLIISFISENILDTNKGIFFFAFFNTVLGYIALKHPNNIAKKLLKNY